MKNILVMQLFRLGDLLQTTPALAALRRRYPGARIALMVRAEFAEAVRGNPDVDEVIEWSLPDEYDGLVPELRLSAGAADALRTFLAPLRARRYDLVYNLSNDFPSALVAYLLHARETMGLVFCRDRRYRVKNDWLRYLFLTNEARLLNTINLVDCFTLACGGKSGGRPTMRVSDEDRARAQALLAAAFGNSDRPIVAMQVGASQAYKRWPAERFAALAERLIARGADIAFLGSSGERSLAQSVVDAVSGGRGRTVNLAGRTRLAEAAAVLERCRLLVSNDTATIHVASAVGARCLALAFGPTGAFETSPCGEGHFVLTPNVSCFPCNWSSQCPGQPCRDLLTVDAVEAAAACALSDGRDLPDVLNTDDLSLYRTGAYPDGLMGLHPVNRPPLTLSVFLRLAYRNHTLRRWVEEGRTGALPDWRPWREELFAWYRCDDPERLAAQVNAAAADLLATRRLADLGAQAATALAACLDRTGGGVPPTGPLGEAVRRLEERVVAAEENDVVRLLIAAFRHNLRDMESLPLRQEIIALRWNYHALGQGCAALARACDEFVAAMSDKIGLRVCADEPIPALAAASAC